MNLNELKKAAQKIGINNNAIDKALNMAKGAGIINNNELSGTPEQFRNIVNSYGGMETLNKGLAKLNNPLVKGALRMCGIDIDKAKESALKAMGQSDNSEARTESELLTRLNKLK